MSIGVVGVGYVGLPLVVAFAAAGEDVIAVDIDQRKVDALTAGESYIEDISSAQAPGGSPPGQRDHALRPAGPDRRDHHLRPDSPVPQP